MARIQFENGITVEFAGNPTPQDVEEVARNLQQKTATNEPQKPGFIQGALQSIVQPVGKLATSIGELGLGTAAVGADFLGYKDAAKNLYSATDSLHNNGVDLGYFGTVKPFSGTGGVGDIKEAVGTGLKVGSLIVPGGASIKSAAALGAASSGLYGAGDVLEQGGSVTDALKSAAVSAPLGAITGGAIAGIPAAAKFVKDKAVKPATSFATSQATGLNPKTLTSIIKNPEKFTPEAVNSFDSTSIASEVDDALKAHRNEVHGLGTAYSPIREARTPVNLDLNQVNGVFKKYGIDVSPKGKLLTSAETVPLKSSDVSDIQNFFNQYILNGEKNSNTILNARGYLDLLRYDKEKTGVVKKIIEDLRDVVDTAAKRDIKGLRELDAKFAPEVRLQNELSKDYLKGDGSLKDNAISKINNLDKPNRKIILDRLEKLIPGIGERINIASAMQDIANTKGIKVGTYTRGVGLGSLIFTGNILGAAFAAVVTHPSVAVPIIRGFARSKGIAGPVIDNIIEKMSRGQVLSTGVKKLIYAAIADYVGDKSVEKKDDQPVDAYLKSLGIE